MFVLFLGVFIFVSYIRVIFLELDFFFFIKRFKKPAFTELIRSVNNCYQT